MIRVVPVGFARNSCQTTSQPNLAKVLYLPMQKSTKLGFNQYTIEMSDLNANNTSAGSGMGAIASIGSMISTA
eukprot:scaffold10583_cov290-Chaetoceros_neogracile.AAC.23